MALNVKWLTGLSLTVNLMTFMPTTLHAATAAQSQTVAISQAVGITTSSQQANTTRTNCAPPCRHRPSTMR